MKPPENRVSFDGNDAFAVVELAPEQRTGPLEISLWVKLRSLREPQVFCGRSERGKLWTLYLYKGAVRMLVENERGKYRFARASAPVVGEWTHYRGTYDGEHVEIHRDGRLAEEVVAPGAIPESDAPLYLGGRVPGIDLLDGELADVRLGSKRLEGWKLQGIGTEKADGYRGIWYSNQPTGDEHRFKYSGGFATYPQQHVPIAVHAPEAQKTFFVYGGAREGSSRLLHMVSDFDHRTGELARPTILLDKETSDAHDNPTLAIDAAGHLWIFSNAHGTSREAYIHRSRRPWSIEGFEHVLTTNFSYGQPWFVPGRGFCFLHTRYEKGRRFLFVQRSRDGREWSDPVPLARVARGHYQVSWGEGEWIGTAFNVHPEEGGLNARTNLYYAETRDGGETWQNVRGEPLDLPLTEIDNAALVVDHASRGELVYLKDLQRDDEGRPVILYLTSGDWRPGRASGERVWRTARWTGTHWDLGVITRSDHNYDFGSLYLERSARWRLLAPTDPGPFAFATGGEIVEWISTDQGAGWKRGRSLTQDSSSNHTFLRRPLNPNPEFYALWAGGDPLQPSTSQIYFANAAGEVRSMPFVMEGNR